VAVAIEVTVHRRGLRRDGEADGETQPRRRATEGAEGTGVAARGPAVDGDGAVDGVRHQQVIVREVEGDGPGATQPRGRATEGAEGGGVAARGPAVDGVGAVGVRHEQLIVREVDGEASGVTQPRRRATEGAEGGDVATCGPVVDGDGVLLKFATNSSSCASAAAATSNPPRSVRSTASDDPHRIPIIAAPFLSERHRMNRQMTGSACGPFTLVCVTRSLPDVVCGMGITPRGRHHTRNAWTRRDDVSAVPSPAPPSLVSRSP
jgi:hypothetical protein